MRAVRAIALDARPGDVVLQRPGGRYPPLPAVLARQRVVYERFTPYLTQFAPADELRRRHEALFRFFRTKDRDEALAIARSSAPATCACTETTASASSGGMLVPLTEEPEGRAYRIADPAGAAVR